MSERTFYERPEVVGGHKFIRLKSGRMTTYWEQKDAAEKAQTDIVRAVSRSIKLADDDYKLELMEWFIEGLEDYVAAVRKYLDEKRGNLSKRDRIALLRNVAGRTPEEAELFLHKADELEKLVDDG